MGSFEEMDEGCGPGSVDLSDNGALTIEFADHNGDEAEFKAARQ